MLAHEECNPYPTGYPTYAMLSWLFTRLPFGSVPWRVQILSGLAGTVTVALVYLIGRRIAEKRESGAAILGAVFSALLLAFAPLF